MEEEQGTTDKRAKKEKKGKKEKKEKKEKALLLLQQRNDAEERRGAYCLERCAAIFCIYLFGVPWLCGMLVHHGTLGSEGSMTHLVLKTEPRRAVETDMMIDWVFGLPAFGNIKPYSESHVSLSTVPDPVRWNVKMQLPEFMNAWFHPFNVSFIGPGEQGGEFAHVFTLEPVPIPVTGHEAMLINAWAVSHAMEHTENVLVTMARGYQDGEVVVRADVHFSLFAFWHYRFDIQKKMYCRTIPLEADGKSITGFATFAELDRNVRKGLMLRGASLNSKAVAPSGLLVRSAANDTVMESDFNFHCDYLGNANGFWSTLQWPFPYLW